MTHTVNDDSNQRSSTAVLIATSLTLFSMFFGAGNLIFPPIMGASAGTNVTPAMIGFLIGGVALPVVSIITIALSGTDMRDLVSRAGKPFWPRILRPRVPVDRSVLRASANSRRVVLNGRRTPHRHAVAGCVGHLLPGVLRHRFYLLLEPRNIIDSLGKILTPILLGLLILLVFLSLASLPASHDAPTGEYTSTSPAAGLLEGS